MKFATSKRRKSPCKPLSPVTWSQSTLHTNDAPGAVTRLNDMGLRTVFDFIQLDVRFRPTPRPHYFTKNCRTTFEPTEDQLAMLNLSPHDLGDKVFHYGRGCSYLQ